MENKGYLICEVGILGGNDKVKTNLFVLFVHIIFLIFGRGSDVMRGSLDIFNCCI